MASKVPEDNFSTELVEQVLQRNKKVDYQTAKSLLLQASDTSFRIHDHLQQAALEDQTEDPQQKRPLSLVAHHEAEDFTVTSKLYQNYELFLQNNVYQMSGMSWLQFLQLPTDIAAMVMLKSKQKTTRDLQSQLDSFRTSQRGLEGMG